MQNILTAKVRVIQRDAPGNFQAARFLCELVLDVGGSKHNALNKYVFKSGRSKRWPVKWVNPIPGSNCELCVCNRKYNVNYAFVTKSIILSPKTRVLNAVPGDYI
jgi:hypothetical protein